MTRSHKQNDRDHKGLADGTAEPEQHLPRYFAKHGFYDADPKKTKKDGSGKGNWGRSGDEIEDEDFNLAKSRRRSNSSVDKNSTFTKYEALEEEPVFEEEVHGDGGYDHYRLQRADTSDTTDNEKTQSEDSSVTEGESISEGKMN